MWVRKDTTDTDETWMLPSHLIDTVSNTSHVLDFINESPGNIFSFRSRDYKLSKVLKVVK